MTDEVLNEGVGASPSEDLRSIITSAVEKQRSGDAGAAESAAPASETPAATKPADGEDRARDDKGRFAPKADAQQPGKPDAAQVTPEAPKADAQTEKPGQETVALRPPVGWPVQAKAQFANLPPEVQQAIAKREAEVDAGFSKYSGLDQFVKAAAANNRTLPQVLDEVSRIDNAFMQNPLAGLQMIMQRYGLNPAHVAQAIMQGGQNIAPQPHQQGGNVDVSQLVQQELQKQTLVRQIDEFKNNPANVYFDNVKDKMAALLNTGLAASLQDAYDKACQLDPDIAPLLNKPATNTIADQSAAVAAQARAAAKAVVGAPAMGMPPAQTAAVPKSTREAILGAIAAQRGGRA